MVSGQRVPSPSAQEQLRETVEADRQRIARGERPHYHALVATSVDGSIDVTVLELPLIHLFVPDEGAAIEGARLAIARALDVDPSAFDVGVGGPRTAA